MKNTTLVLALTLAACSTTVDERPGVVLDCHVAHGGCPTADELAIALTLFAGYVPGFDPELPLTIEWWPSDACLKMHVDDAGQEWCRNGEAPAGDYVITTSFPVLAHELMHAHIWREYVTTGDSTHADPPGPWTTETDALVEEIRIAYEEVLTRY